MKRNRHITGFRGQQGIVHARFLAVMLFCLSACLYGVMYTAGILQGLSDVFLPTGKHTAGRAYDAGAAPLGIVKIVCGDFRGSGVVIAQDEEGIVIASAKHLLMHDVRATVSFAGTVTGESAEGEVIGYSASYDLAYLYVPRPALSAEAADSLKSVGATENVSGTAWAVTLDDNGQQAAVRTDDAYGELRAGDTIIQIGLSETARLECYTGTAQAKEVFISDYNASMLLNECYAAAGMSGGGAFDKEGRLVGIIIAGDAQGTVCMPMTTVLYEYRELMEGKKETPIMSNEFYYH